LRLPSWSELTEKLNKFEKYVNDKRTETGDRIQVFKGKHPLIDTIISDAIILLPPPFGGIAKAIYNSFDTSRKKEGTDAVLNYFNALKNQGANHYNNMALSLDNILIKITDEKQITDALFLDLKNILISSGKAVNKKLDLLKNEIEKIEGKIDGIDETTRDTKKIIEVIKYKTTEIEEKLRQITNSQRIPLQVKSGEKIMILQSTLIDLDNIIKEKVKLQEETARLKQPPDDFGTHSQIKTEEIREIPESVKIKPDKRSRKLEKLYKKMEELEKQQPEFDTDHLLIIANTYYYAGEYNKAHKHYRYIEKKNPKHVPALNGIGAVFAAKAFSSYGSDKDNNYSMAIFYYDKALKIDPNNVITLDNKGRALVAQYSYKDAIKCYDKILEINPYDDATLGNKGFALYELGKHLEAISYYDKALKIDPNNVITLDNKGRALAKLRRYEEAISCYDKALEIVPDNIDVVRHRISALKKRIKRKWEFWK